VGSGGRCLRLKEIDLLIPTIPIFKAKLRRLKAQHAVSAQQKTSLSLELRRQNNIDTYKDTYFYQLQCCSRGGDDFTNVIHRRIAN